jgi:hypothetical protein
MEVIYGRKEMYLVYGKEGNQSRVLVDGGIPRLPLGARVVMEDVVKKRRERGCREEIE